MSNSRRVIARCKRSNRGRLSRPLAPLTPLSQNSGQRDGAITGMREAADLDDASEKNVAMENKLVPIRALLGELYLTAGMNKEALGEFEASDKAMPNRFRMIAGAAAAARASGSVEAAKRYYRALTALTIGDDGDRPEIAEAQKYLAQN
jgi:hypothetical protein